MKGSGEEERHHRGQASERDKHKERRHREEEDPERKHRDRRHREEENPEKRHRDRGKREEEDLERNHRDGSSSKKPASDKSHRQETNTMEKEVSGLVYSLYRLHKTDLLLWIPSWILWLPFLGLSSPPRLSTSRVLLPGLKKKKLHSACTRGHDKKRAGNMGEGDEKCQ